MTGRGHGTTHRHLAVFLSQHAFRTSTYKGQKLSGLFDGDYVSCVSKNVSFCKDFVQSFCGDRHRCDKKCARYFIGQPCKWLCNNMYQQVHLLPSCLHRGTSSFVNKYTQ